MSLLDKATEEVLVFPEETFTDSDGNLGTRPSTVGIPFKAVLQVSAASGTSARRAEQDNEGYESELGYRMRFARDFPYVLGAQSCIVWRGQRWAIVGDRHEFFGSSKTAHVEYQIQRS